jgi:hypothetical protein
MSAFLAASIVSQKVKITSSKMPSFLRHLSVIASVFALVGAAPKVTISAGKLLGTTCSNGASAFLSIPFAIPPIGSLRWTSPQPYNQKFPASGFNATTQGPLCFQFGKEFTESGTPSEDWYLSFYLMSRKSI